MPARLLVAIAAAAALATSPATASAAKPVWLCNPLIAKDPCRTSLTATVVAPPDKVLKVQHTRIPKRPPVDCFYVYPTISFEQQLQADLKIGPELRAIALFQAARFSQVCRVWAPVYRQFTLFGLLAHPTEITQSIRNEAYADVRSAFRYYMRHYNNGRGIVFVGHSQGTGVLRRLIQDEVDSKPAMRGRMVMAVLAGGNIVVRGDGKPGGDFRHVRPCARKGASGCFMAWSTFSETPPANTIFGRASTSDRAKGLEVACTNPAALDGGTGALTGYVPATPFPGPFGDTVRGVTGPVPRAATPWLETRRFYSARCERVANAHVLMTVPLDGAPVLTAEPDHPWGLHLADVNIGLADVIADVTAATKSWLRSVAASS